MSKEYFIRKKGLYYGPDNRGYTDRPILAGLFTLEDAISASHPNGPDGPRDGIRYFHESECRDADYVAHKALKARVLELEAQIKAALDACDCADELVAQQEPISAASVTIWVRRALKDKP